MGLFGNTCRRTKNDPTERDLVFPLPPVDPQRKPIHNLPKTTSHQISHHQYDDPGIDPMNSPHPRIQYKGFTPRTKKRPRVITIMNTHLNPSWHCSVTTTVTWPNQNVTYVTSESPVPPTKGQIQQNEEEKVFLLGIPIDKKLLSTINKNTNW